VSGDWVYIHSTLSRETGVPQLVMRQPLRSQAGPITSVFAGTDERQLSDEAFWINADVHSRSHKHDREACGESKVS